MSHSEIVEIRFGGRDIALRVDSNSANLNFPFVRRFYVPKNYRARIVRNRGQLARGLDETQALEPSNRAVAIVSREAFDPALTPNSSRWDLNAAGPDISSWNSKSPTAEWLKLTSSHDVLGTALNEVFEVPIMTWDDPKQSQWKQQQIYGGVNMETGWNFFMLTFDDDVTLAWDFWWFIDIELEWIGGHGSKAEFNVIRLLEMNQ